MNLTEEQQNIINISGTLKQGQSLKIDACAGSGKTFTLVAITKAYKEKRFLYLAFNKAVVEQARSRFPNNVSIYTTHSLAFQSIFKNKNTPFIKANLNVFDLEPVFGNIKYNYKEISSTLNKFMAFCHSDVKSYPDNSIFTVFEAMDKGIIPMCHDFYLKKYQMQNQHPELDFYDYILLDEAQDTNLVTMDIFKSNNARKILVGDSHQSIYGFRGAYNAIENFKSDFKQNISYSFRSNEEICRRANCFIKTFASDKKTYLPMKSYGQINTNPQPKNAVITRTNSGLITYILKLTEEQKQRATLIREPDLIFRPAINVLKFINNENDFDKEYAYLKRFTSLEKLKEYAHDSVDLELETAIHIATDLKNKLYDVYQEAQHLYNNRFKENINIFFTTAHTAKGLEWDQVLMADDFCDLRQLKKLYKKSGHKKKVIDYLFNQEVNLIYVTITRAKTLFIDRSENNKIYLEMKDKVLPKKTTSPKDNIHEK